ncbi:MAG: DUF1289 domain-containing protein [Gammaproteobacteria bacterium]|nr:DUF1289 domain-containing protein [Gammaproteobacteria bacterium]
MSETSGPEASKTHSMSEMVASPCIGVCQLTDDESGEQVCHGCHRTLSEIANWRNFSDQQKLQVLNRIKLKDRIETEQY